MREGGLLHSDEVVLFLYIFHGDEMLCKYLPCVLLTYLVAFSLQPGKKCLAQKVTGWKVYKYLNTWLLGNFLTT